MFKKKLIVTALALTTVIGVSAPTTVKAASISADTNSAIEFGENTDGEPNPVDPEVENPDPIKPPVVPLPKGALRFNWVPTIDFGKVLLRGDTTTYKAHFEDVTDLETNVVSPRASFIEVMDERAGVAKGWKVTAKGDGVFTHSTDSAKKFNSVIKMGSTTIRGLNNQDAGQIPAVFGATTPVTIASTANAVQPLIEAKASADQGRGRFQARFGLYTTTTNTQADEINAGEATPVKRNSAVTVTVPEGQIVYADAKYTSKITWTLEDTL